VIKDFGESFIICHGKDTKKVHEDAVKKDYLEPVIIFIPAREIVQIYFSI